MLQPLFFGRSFWAMIKSNPQSPINSGGKPVDNELFVPLSGHLPTVSTTDETQNPTAPNPTPPEPPKATKPTREHKRKIHVSTPESEPVKKKKAPAVKPSPAEAGSLEFTEAKPDVARMILKSGFQTHRTQCRRYSCNTIIPR
jgi:hypothetical protein